MRTDLNQVLRELRGLLATPGHSDMQRMRIAELFSILDTELSDGAQLPDDWNYGVARGAVSSAEIDFNE